MKVEFNPIVAWNTNCAYTDQGQRIAVFAVKVNDVLKAYYMKDLDRGLHYFYLPLTGLAHALLVRRHVMSCYLYSHSVVYLHSLIGDQVSDFLDAKSEADQKAYDLEFPVWIGWRTL